MHVSGCLFLVYLLLLLVSFFLENAVLYKQIEWAIIIFPSGSSLMMATCYVFACAVQSENASQTVQASLRWNVRAGPVQAAHVRVFL